MPPGPGRGKSASIHFTHTLHNFVCLKHVLLGLLFSRLGRILQHDPGWLQAGGGGAGRLTPTVSDWRLGAPCGVNWGPQRLQRPLGRSWSTPCCTVRTKTGDLNKQLGKGENPRILMGAFRDFWRPNSKVSLPPTPDSLPPTPRKSGSLTLLPAGPQHQAPPFTAPQVPHCWCQLFLVPYPSVFTIQSASVYAPSCNWHHWHLHRKQL